MKKLKIHYFFLALASVVFSCEEEEKIVLNSSATVSPSTSTSTVALSKENEGEDALTVTWAKPDYGFQASATYFVTLYNQAGDSIAINNGGEIGKTFKTEELNKHLLNLGYEAGVASPLQIKVLSRLTSTRSIVSEAIDVTVTPYTSFLDLSTSWGVVGSGYNNWGAFPDAPFFVSSTANVIVAYVTLVDGEIKFRENNDWGNNLGDDGGDGTLEPNGANIAVEAGTYKISFNTADNTYSIEPYSWGIVGSAYNNWGGDGPDFPFSYDPATDQWRALVKLLDGEYKIRKNNDWAVNYGDDGANGTLEQNGANIASTAGKYLITFNEKDLTMTSEPIPAIWGLVGSAYNNWGGDGPDAQFQRDFRGEGLWILKSVHLLAGEFKIRDSNDWATNYGDDGADGTLQLNGANIAVAAEGYYDVALDFSNPESPTITVTKL